MTVLLRSELRQNEQGEPEVWLNFGDLLDWLGELPAHTQHSAAAGAAAEIRQILLDQFRDAEIQEKG